VTTVFYRQSCAERRFPIGLRAPTWAAAIAGVQSVRTETCCRVYTGFRDYPVGLRIGYSQPPPRHDFRRDGIRPFGSSHWRAADFPIRARRRRAVSPMRVQPGQLQPAAGLRPAIWPSGRLPVSSAARNCWRRASVWMEGCVATLTPASRAAVGGWICGDRDASRIVSSSRCPPQCVFTRNQGRKSTQPRIVVAGSIWTRSLENPLRALQSYFTLLTTSTPNHFFLGLPREIQRTICLAA
jgi:hypothetical protein